MAIDAGTMTNSRQIGQTGRGGYMTTSITQLLPEDRLFQSGTTNAPLLRADPDYIGGVKADILTYRAPATPQGGTGTSLCRSAGRPEHTADPAAQQPRSDGTPCRPPQGATEPHRKGTRCAAKRRHFRRGPKQNRRPRPWLPPGLDPYEPAQIHPIGGLYTSLEFVRRTLTLQTGRLQLPDEGTTTLDGAQVFGRSVRLTQGLMNISP